MDEAPSAREESAGGENRPGEEQGGSAVTSAEGSELLSPARTGDVRAAGGAGGQERSGIQPKSGILPGSGAGERIEETARVTMTDQPTEAERPTDFAGLPGDRQNPARALSFACLDEVARDLTGQGVRPDRVAVWTASSPGPSEGASFAAEVSPSLSPSRSLSLSHTHSLSLPGAVRGREFRGGGLSLSPSLSLSRAHTHTLSLSLPLSLPPSLSHTQTLAAGRPRTVASSLRTGGRSGREGMGGWTSL